MKELLPIGSVVLLKNAKKRLMIIGILTAKRQDEKLYDYLGVVYPEGFMGADNNFLFDHEDIEEVVFTGYSDEERDLFMKAMKIAYSQHQS